MQAAIVQARTKGRGGVSHSLFRIRKLIQIHKRNQTNRASSNHLKPVHKKSPIKISHIVMGKLELLQGENWKL